MAITTVGVGQPGLPAAATPRCASDAPTITGVVPGNRTLTVSITAPASDGGSTVQSYEYSLDGGETWVKATADLPSSPQVVRGLTNGVRYPLVVRAITDAGPGAPSASYPATPTVTPVAVDTGGADAQRPVVAPGDSRLWVDGQPTAVRTGVEGGTWKVTGDDFTVTLQGFESTGTALQVDAEGRLVVREGGYVEVSGTGFAPNSVVDVWMFSTPYLLGTVTVDEDGAFTASLPLPEEIEVGEHTLQLNGEAADGSLRSLSTGLVVEAALVDPIPDPADPDPADPADPGVIDPADPDTTDPDVADPADPADPDVADPADPDATDPDPADPADPADPDVTDPDATDPTDPTDPGSGTSTEGALARTGTGVVAQLMLIGLLISLGFAGVVTAGRWRRSTVRSDH